MRRTIERIGLALACLATVATLAGCDSMYPQPSEDAVYYFLANARIHGRIRVCWPAGQEYAVGIAAADTELQKELGKLWDLVGYKSEWPADDPRWFDSKVLDEHVKALEELAEVGARNRRKALEKLEKLLDGDPPAGLEFASDAARDAFRQRLRDALEMDGEPLRDHIARYEKLLAKRLALFQKVRDCAESLKEDAGELQFDDETCQEEVDALRRDWTASVVAERERLFALAADGLAAIRPVIGKLDKQKQRQKYNYLDNQRTCCKRFFEAKQHELNELIRAEQKSLKDIERGKIKAKQRVADFHKRRLEELQAELDAVTKRSNAILKPAPAE